jgi:hypothetical protein
MIQANVGHRVAHPNGHDAWVPPRMMKEGAIQSDVFIQPRQGRFMNRPYNVSIHAPTPP